MELETARLRLRPVVPADAADLFAYSREPQVGPNAGWKPHESLDETKALMKMLFLDQPGVFALVRKDTGQLIGTAGLIQDTKRENPLVRMLGYAISSTCWGQGLMPEAVAALLGFGFQVMGLELISAYCYPHNRRSIRVLEKCGFQYEGRLTRGSLRYDGCVLDELCYCRLPDEGACKDGD